MRKNVQKRYHYYRLYDKKVYFIIGVVKPTKHIGKSEYIAINIIRENRYITIKRENLFNEEMYLYLGAVNEK